MYNKIVNPNNKKFPLTNNLGIKTMKPYLTQIGSSDNNCKGLRMREKTAKKYGQKTCDQTPGCKWITGKKCTQIMGNDVRDLLEANRLGQYIIPCTTIESLRTRILKANHEEFLTQCGLKKLERKRLKRILTETPSKSIQTISNTLNIKKPPIKEPPIKKTPIIKSKRTDAIKRWKKAKNVVATTQYLTLHRKLTLVENLLKTHFNKATMKKRLTNSLTKNKISFNNIKDPFKTTVLYDSNFMRVKSTNVYPKEYIHSPNTFLKKLDKIYEHWIQEMSIISGGNQMIRQLYSDIGMSAWIDPLLNYLSLVYDFSFMGTFHIMGINFQYDHQHKPINGTIDSISYFPGEFSDAARHRSTKGAYFNSNGCFVDKFSTINSAARMTDAKEDKKRLWEEIGTVDFLNLDEINL